MILEHYSVAPLGELRAIEQIEHFDMKPRGLWLSVAGEYGWPEWCRDTWGEGSQNNHRQQFTLAPGANVRHLETVVAIDEFTDEFGGPPFDLFPGWLPGLWVIDWRRVAERYDGIIISPYQPARRLQGKARGWYYTWDCASGCIFRPEILVRVP